MKSVILSHDQIFNLAQCAQHVKYRISMNSNIDAEVRAGSVKKLDRIIRKLNRVK